MNHAIVKHVAMRVVPVIGLLGLAGLPTAPASLQRSGPQVVPPDQRIDGKTYAQWSAAWWQWALSLPCVPGHPFLDDPAFDVTLGQTGNVWFLAAPFGTVQRTISIPAGTRLFLALLTAEVSSLERNESFGCTEAEQRAQSKFLADHIVGPHLVIDGVPLSRVRRHRVSSPQFDIILPDPNCLGVQAGTFTPCVSPPPPPMVGTAVSDGYFAMIRGLSRGQHTIHFGGEIFGFGLEMTYHVTVF